MFLKVLSHLILKTKSFIKYFKKGLEIIQNFHEIFKYFKVKYFIAHLEHGLSNRPIFNDLNKPKPRFQGQAIL